MVPFVSRSGAQPKQRTRHLDGVPGTVTHGFREQEIRELRLPLEFREGYKRFTGSTVEENEVARYAMGPCNILVSREPAAVGGERLWHLTISTPSRHPTWDEIKVARYRLLPAEICVGILLPPAEFYVNVEAQDHVFQLWEVTDPREQWTTG